MQSKNGAGILFICLGMTAISFNDLLIKMLSGSYPLHEIVFFRAIIGIGLCLVIVRLEGGWHILRTKSPGLHALRAALIIVSNMTYFTALAAMPLADATALFFVAPLFITLLSIPMLGEKVGARRMGAVVVGFTGVIIMQQPWARADALEVTRIVLLLPVLSALTYALNQIMTRRLGVNSTAGALAFYIQLGFLIVSTGFFLVAGDGRFAEGAENPSLQFLLRAWVWPQTQDIWVLVALGCTSTSIGYCLSQAYRLANAGVLAPFEYIGLPLAVFWGFTIFGDLPTLAVWVGAALIFGSGLFVGLREARLRSRQATTPRAPRL